MRDPTFRAAGLGVLASSALVLALVACNAEGPPPVAPVELSIPPLASAQAATKGASPNAGAVDAHRCVARLRPDPIQTESGCELDERLTRGPGQLMFPCKGDGLVEAIFDEHRFEGRVEGGNAVLHLTTELDWQDSCHWETRQELRGRLEVDDGVPRATKLVWSYTERPVRGTSCYRACKARADIVVGER